MKNGDVELASTGVSMVGNAPVSLLVNGSGVIQGFNQEGSRLVQNMDVSIIGRRCCDVFSCDALNIQDCPLVLCKEKKVRQTRTIQRAGGSIIETAEPVLDADGSVTGMILSFSRADQQSVVTDDLARIQKYERVWHVCRGIVHDLNNVMTCVNGGIDLLKEGIARTENSEQQLKTLSILEPALEQGRWLTQQINKIGRENESQAEGPVEIGKIIRDTVAFSMLGDKHPVTVNISDKLWWVWSDPGKISQLIGNLIINARHALDPNRRDANIVVKAENIHGSDAERAGLEPGHYVRIVIEDAGKGIPAEQLERIFDPFFTTKTNGTGLGLAVVKWMVQEHEGRITVESKVGAGSKFTVYLPALVM